MPDLQPAQFYHGTTAAGLKRILPAAQHRGAVTFPSDTDTGFAYATTHPADAWHYAEKAWHASDRGVPRVYRVEPIGPHETDPSTDMHGALRGNLAGDVRARAGFRVLGEELMPEQMGKAEDWR